MIFTWTAWPWATTSRGFSTWCCASSEMCTRPFDAGEDLDEGAERDDLRDAALDDVVHGVAVEHLLPRIALGLLQPERDALAVAVDVEHLDLHLLADLEHLRGWFTWPHESSEMWIRPSMPSRSTKAPKSTMFEIARRRRRPG